MTVSVASPAARIPVAAKSVPVRELDVRALFAPERGEIQGVVKGCCRKRSIPSAHSLPHAENFRSRADVLRSEPVARSSHARDHLVKDQEDLVFAADLPYKREILGRRRDDSARVSDRLDDECSH